MQNSEIDGPQRTALSLTSENTNTRQSRIFRRLPSVNVKRTWKNKRRGNGIQTDASERYEGTETTIEETTENASLFALSPQQRSIGRYPSASNSSLLPPVEVLIDSDYAEDLSHFLSAKDKMDLRTPNLDAENSEDRSHVYVFEECSDDEEEERTRSQHQSPLRVARSLPGRFLSSPITGGKLLSLQKKEEQEEDDSECDGFSISAETDSCASSVTWYEGEDIEEITVASDEIEKYPHLFPQRSLSNLSSPGSLYTWDS